MTVITRNMDEFDMGGARRSAMMTPPRTSSELHAPAHVTAIAVPRLALHEHVSKAFRPQKPK